MKTTKSKMNALILASVLLTIQGLASSPSMAQSTSGSASSGGSTGAYTIGASTQDLADCNQTANTNINNQITLNQNYGLKSQLPSPANPGLLAGQFSCLDRLKNMSVTGALGIPNVFQQLITAASTLVCSEVNKQMSSVNASISQNMHYPGIQIPGAGTIGGSSGNVGIGSGTGQGMSVNGTSVVPPITAPSVFGQTSTIFQTADQLPNQTPQPSLLDKMMRSIKSVF